jgi:hypothetical protein
MQVLINIAVALFILAAILLIAGWQIDRYMGRGEYYGGPGVVMFVIGALAMCIDIFLWLVYVCAYVIGGLLL